MVSKLVGQLARIPLPLGIRSLVYLVGGSLFGVNFSEILYPLESFSTWNEFFSRKVIPRVVDKTQFSLVSPADSVLLSLTEVTADSTLLVKDVNYSVANFITGQYGLTYTEEQISNLRYNKNTKLFSLLFYLSPKDYHRFHSMANCTIFEQIHVGGLLYPVKDSYIGRVTVVVPYCRASTRSTSA